jgi:hypothetical protein
LGVPGAQANGNSKGGYLMHEKKHSQQQEQENRSKDRLQQEFEDEMEEMIMDLRFFIC